MGKFHKYDQKQDPFKLRWPTYAVALVLLLLAGSVMYYRTYTCSKMACPSGKSPVLVEAYFNDTCICADLKKEYGL